jgi:hypothetical protein
MKVQKKRNESMTLQWRWMILIRLWQKQQRMNLDKPNEVKEEMAITISHSSQDDPGPIPIIGTHCEDIGTILRHLPARQAERAERVREVALFEEHMFREYCKVHLVTLFPQQPDMMWDYAAWWTRPERHGYSVFKDIVIMDNFVSFCEQWFVHMDYESTRGGHG